MFPVQLNQQNPLFFILHRSRENETRAILELYFIEEKFSAENILLIPRLHISFETLY